MSRRQTSLTCVLLCAATLSHQKVVVKYYWLMSQFMVYLTKKLRCYVIVDEQSSSTFADPKVAEFFDIQSPVSNYNLKTLSGSSTETRGILLKNLRIN